MLVSTEMTMSMYSHSAAVVVNCCSPSTEIMRSVDSSVLRSCSRTGLEGCDRLLPRHVGGRHRDGVRIGSAAVESAPASTDPVRIPRAPVDPAGHKAIGRMVSIALWAHVTAPSGRVRVPHTAQGCTRSAIGEIVGCTRPRHRSPRPAGG